jgi:hypothetical protein
MSDSDKNKHNFSFDWKAFNQWLAYYIETISEQNSGVSEEKENVWVVNPSNYNSNSYTKLIWWKDNYGDEVWKVNYFIQDDIDISYRNHLLSHAKHTIEQPRHYRGMFEILN